MSNILTVVLIAESIADVNFWLMTAFFAFWQVFPISVMFPGNLCNY